MQIASMERWVLLKNWYSCIITNTFYTLSSRTKRMVRQRRGTAPTIPSKLSVADPASAPPASRAKRNISRRQRAIAWADPPRTREPWDLPPGLWAKTAQRRCRPWPVTSVAAPHARRTAPWPPRPARENGNWSQAGRRRINNNARSGRRAAVYIRLNRSTAGTMWRTTRACWKCRICTANMMTRITTARGTMSTRPGIVASDWQMTVRTRD